MDLRWGWRLLRPLEKVTPSFPIPKCSFLCLFGPMSSEMDLHCKIKKEGSVSDDWKRIIKWCFNWQLSNFMAHLPSGLEAKAFSASFIKHLVQAEAVVNMKWAMCTMLYVGRSEITQKQSSKNIRMIWSGIGRVQSDSYVFPGRILVGFSRQIWLNCCTTGTNALDLLYFFMVRCRVFVQ